MSCQSRLKRSFSAFFWPPQPHSYSFPSGESNVIAIPSCTASLIRFKIKMFQVRKCNKWWNQGKWWIIIVYIRIYSTLPEFNKNILLNFMIPWLFPYIRFFGVWSFVLLFVWLFWVFFSLNSLWLQILPRGFLQICGLQSSLFFSLVKVKINVNSSGIDRNHVKLHLNLQISDEIQGLQSRLLWSSSRPYRKLEKRKNKTKHGGV